MDQSTPSVTLVPYGSGYALRPNTTGLYVVHYSVSLEGLSNTDVVPRIGVFRENLLVPGTQKSGFNFKIGGQTNISASAIISVNANDRLDLRVTANFGVNVLPVYGALTVTGLTV
jgi:hypothetical protein